MTRPDPVARPAGTVVPFPPAVMLARNEARLARARAVLRSAGDHDTFALCMACNTLAELGTASDAELADLILAQATGHLDRSRAPQPPRRPHPAATAAAAVATALVVLLIVYDAPARVAATVLQAEQAGGW